MKFAIVSNLFAPHVRGGYEVGCEIIARRLTGLGHDVTVLTSAAVGQLKRGELKPGLTVRPIFEPVFEYEELLHARMADDPIFSNRLREAMSGVLVGNAMALSGCLSEIRPDVIWIFNPLGLGTIGILEAALGQPGARVVISLMDDIDAAVARHRVSAGLEGRYRRLKSKIAAISCSGKTLRANEQLGAYRAHEVIYNGIAFDEIPCHDAAAPGEGCRFVYFGQIFEAKGITQIIRGAGELRRSSPELRFSVDLIGRATDSFQAELERAIRENGLGGIVRLAGFMPREELLSGLIHYDAAIMLLGEDESFGYAPVEAGAAGLPVILTPFAGVAECFPEDYGLFVVDRNDAAEVAGKMRWCCAHAAQLRPMGLRLRSHLLRSCELDRVAMPRYLQAVENCEIGTGACCVESLLASYTTGRLYSRIG